MTQKKKPPVNDLAADAVLITAWAQTHGGAGGWTNRAVHAIYYEPHKNALREVVIQPDEQTAAMGELFDVSEAAHRSTCSAVARAKAGKR